MHPHQLRLFSLCFFVTFNLWTHPDFRCCPKELFGFGKTHRTRMPFHSCIFLWRCSHKIGTWGHGNRVLKTWIHAFLWPTQDSNTCSFSVLWRCDHFSPSSSRILWHIPQHCQSLSSARSWWLCSQFYCITLEAQLLGTCIHSSFPFQNCIPPPSMTQICF